jgi:P-type conjugative transfer protein TrbL
MPTLPANTNVVNTDPDTLIGDTKKYLNNLSEKILKPLTDKLYKYGDILRKAAFRLFTYLFGFGILWRFIKFLVRGEYDLKLWLLDTALIIILMQFIMYTIKNANVVNMQIINWFMSVAGEATGIDKISPSVILDLAMDYFVAQVKFVISMSFNDLLKGMLLLAISGMSAFALCMMIILYIKALVESIIIAQFSVIFLAFLGLEQTRDIGTRPFLQWINIGIKLMFLQMMIGLEHDLLKDFIHMDEINVASAISVLFVSVFMLLITWEIPSLFEKIIMGSTAINGFSQQAVSSLNRLISEIKTGGLTGNIAKGALGAGVGVAQNIGGVQQALKAHENYKTSQASSNSSSAGNNINSGSIGFTKNPSSNNNHTNGFSSSTSTGLNPNDSIKNKILSPIGASASNSSVNNQSSNNTVANNSQSSSSSNNQTLAQSSASMNSNTNMGKIKGLAGGAKELIQEKYKQGVSNTIGGKLANHFDSKTKANNEIKDKESINAFYKNLWDKPEPQNVNTILENHNQNKQDKEGK